MGLNCEALAKRLFPERQLLLRSGERLRYMLLPGWTQAAGLVAVLAVVGGVGGLAGAYHHLHKAIHDKELAAEAAMARTAALGGSLQILAQAEEQYSQISQEFAETRAELDAADAKNGALRSAIEGVEDRVSLIDEQRHQLEQSLTVTEKALAGKSGNVSRLAKELAASKRQLRAIEASRAELETQLHRLRADPMASATQTSQLTKADQANGNGMPSTYVGKLQQLIASTGIDLNRYLSQYERPANEGGPFTALDLRSEKQPDTEQQKQLEALVQSLPLAAPLVHYTVTSPYGPRIDPFNHEPAFHAGIDFAAVYKSPVLATAPGVVTFTGWRGAYGRLVEIAHTNGIVTRYSHLHRILVAVGQRVALHQEVGELGSTGRSTGPHVYYEVLVDGAQIDPAKFLEAGRNAALIKVTH